MPPGLSARFFPSIRWPCSNSESEPQVGVRVRLRLFRPGAVGGRSQPRRAHENAAKSKRRKGFVFSSAFRGFLGVSHCNVITSVFSEVQPSSPSSPLPPLPPVPIPIPPTKTGPLPESDLSSGGPILLPDTIGQALPIPDRHFTTREPTRWLARFQAEFLDRALIRRTADKPGRLARQTGGSHGGEGLTPLFGNHENAKARKPENRGERSREENGEAAGSIPDSWGTLL